MSCNIKFELVFVFFRAFDFGHSIQFGGFKSPEKGFLHHGVKY
jgi:hypothetical protein